MSAAIDVAWQRGAFPYAYALSLVELTPPAGGEHPYRAEAPPLEQAALWHDHGRRCWHLAKYDEAEHALQRAYEVRRSILGPDDPRTLDTAERIAAVASARGQASRATGLFTQVVEGFERTHGHGSVRLAIARRNFAAHRRTIGELGLAHGLLTAAKDVLERALPAEDPAYVDLLKVEAFWCYRSGAFRQALAIADRAVALGTAAWDVDHPFVAAIHLTAASAERQLGILRSARRRLAQVIPCFERSYGDHPLTAIALAQQARIELDDDNHDLAEHLARRALTIYRGFDTPGVAALAATLIRILAERGEFAEASALAAECEPLADEPSRYTLWLGLAEAQLATARIADGLATLRRARALAPADRTDAIDQQLDEWAHELDDRAPS